MKTPLFMRWKGNIHMNYINNASASLCCSLGASDRIEIEETSVLVDCETNKTMDTFCSMVVPGRMYRCERRWMLKQSFNLLKMFDTREDAQSAYDDLIRQLAEVNTVIKI